MAIMAVLVVLSLALGLVGYLFLMIFYPEWVGITGKVARRNMKSHQGEDGTVEE